MWVHSELTYMNIDCSRYSTGNTITAFALTTPLFYALCSASFSVSHSLVSRAHQHPRPSSTSGFALTQPSPWAIADRQLSIHIPRHSVAKRRHDCALRNAKRRKRNLLREPSTVTHLSSSMTRTLQRHCSTCPLSCGTASGRMLRTRAKR